MMTLISAVIGYLMGGVSGAILIAKAFGFGDIRKAGSGNAGTTNVLRTMGYLPGVLTLVFDALKVYIACHFGLLLAGQAGLLAAGVCAVAGHIWPVWFRFRGGKGLAAALGVILAVSPLMGVVMFLLQVVVLVITRKMSIASLVNIALYPVFQLLFCRGREGLWMYIVSAVLVSLMSLYAHRENILRLIRHEEKSLDLGHIKFGPGKK